ncbi:helix-turn-helix domain-containing protein [Streptococcus thermophilus]|uniref:XRE family transcriptional regulator n=1 Tax=Streptococcus thermophilus TaxID=1308 RepID=A0A8D6U688_STRTR|nr:helix-turn-helix transcriptional regulator [Streptococcus thermophilus]MCT2957724.1 XRE family transcriptional regulator [Streptococcus thermophilus]CAD0135635.1 XRE family transcriptional regulator [Streptococcus thermophilus]
MNNLKKLRKSKGLTQQELAKEMGTTKLTISNWENEKHTIKADKAKQLADYFGVSVAYLLGYSDFKDEDSYYEKMEKERILDVDVLNSISTIGEKNLPLVYDFLKKEFEKEYAPFFKSNEEVDGWTFDESVKTSMRNVTENLWGLPDSIVKLVIYWCTLKDNERESLLEVIKTLSLNNLDKDLFSADND